MGRFRRGNDDKNFAFNKTDNKTDNETDNKVDNKLDNDVENKLDNKVDNKVENSVENKVETTVDVKVDVEIKADIDLDGHKPSDDDLMDIDDIDLEDMDGLFSAVASNVDQDVDGKGNDAAFNLQQINNLVDNDKLEEASIKAEDDAFKDDFEMDAKAFGGFAKVDDVDAKIDDAGSIAETGIASADASINQEAFTQNIVQGANIQFNEINIRNVGDDIEDSVLL